MNNIKQKRISSDINKALCEIILEETRDSLLKNITITGCEVTSDLSFCKVYFTSFNNDNIKDLEKNLNDDTAGYLRTKLANIVKLRHTPKLVFKYDTSIDYATRIEKKLQEINEGIK